MFVAAMGEAALAAANQPSSDYALWSGLRAVEKLYGENLAAKVWDKVEGS